MKIKLPKWFPGSTQGSKLRHLLSYLVVLLCCLIAFDLSFGIFSKLGLDGFERIPWFFLFLAPVYFYMITIGVIRLVSCDFAINAVRLIRDIAVSALFSIFSLAYFFSQSGINGPCRTDSFRDMVYFSTVTFSTLGYGDCSPSDASRLTAASGAILGNLHLGMLVGATYLLLELSKLENRQSSKIILRTPHRKNRRQSRYRIQRNR